MQLTKSLVGTAEVELEELKKSTNYSRMDLEYYMLEVQSCNQEVEQPSYGIQITKTQVDSSNNLDTETELIPDISTNREEVRSILQKLVKNKVTPVGLFNIIEDFVGVH